MKKRGRPSTFDKDQALRSAMTLFWRVGYEGTTVAQLQEAMGGLCAPSLYAAFGSKDELFRQAIDLYSAEECPVYTGALEKATAREAVESLLRETAISYTTPGKPSGCLIDLGAPKTAPKDHGVAEFLKACRQRTDRAILARLRRGVEDGDLFAEADLEGLAAYCTTVLRGLSIQANDGASRECLMTVIDGAMLAWEGMLARRKTVSAS